MGSTGLLRPEIENFRKKVEKTAENRKTIEMVRSFLEKTKDCLIVSINTSTPRSKNSHIGRRVLRNTTPFQPHMPLEEAGRCTSNLNPRIIVSMM